VSSVLTVRARGLYWVLDISFFGWMMCPGGACQGLWAPRLVTNF